MSDQETEPQPKKKKGGKKKLLLLVVAALVIGGGGVGGGLYASGMIGGHGGPAEDPNKPKLVAREGADKGKVAAASHANKADPQLFQATYYPIKDGFTANLNDGGTFIQLGLGVSTYYDERVIQAVERHEMAIRSAVLMTLSGEDPLAIASPGGKAELQKHLTSAVNDVLKQKEGYAGVVDDVYFTSFVLQ
ncbi:flagellar basal body-associated FliL family protein [Allosphingosinicella indica]|uniref:Flagellar protein FliL n=1 Tax=Allosphingosinicella indica TaxID=941907 RepID=A0A1X7GP19_9SPHN|nr:flagellar basal body-associated FliL family protein [Allosphingosinicella indica]SMF72632.1 flagellar FliL protein [Allosphingosinicella indica]